MGGWHHRLNGHEFEPTLGDSEGQGSLSCCSPWGSQKVGHSLATEQQQSCNNATPFNLCKMLYCSFIKHCNFFYLRISSTSLSHSLYFMSEFNFPLLIQTIEHIFNLILSFVTQRKLTCLLCKY